MTQFSMTVWFCFYFHFESNLLCCEPNLLDPDFHLISTANVYLPYSINKHISSSTESKITVEFPRYTARLFISTIKVICHVRYSQEKSFPLRKDELICPVIYLIFVTTSFNFLLNSFKSETFANNHLCKAYRVAIVQFIRNQLFIQERQDEFTVIILITRI